MATLAYQEGMVVTAVTVLLEKSAILDLRVIWVTLGARVLLAFLAPVAPRAIKATLVLKALVALKGLRDPAVKLVPMARMVFRDREVYLV